jgi:WXG100 family type VII secretion target
MSNGGHLVVDIRALQQASADIQFVVGRLESQLGDLERDAAPLVATWEGPAQQAYGDRQTRWRRSASDLSQILRNIKNAVDQSAADYDATEKRNTGLFQ